MSSKPQVRQHPIDAIGWLGDIFHKQNGAIKIRFMGGAKKVTVTDCLDQLPLRPTGDDRRQAIFLSTTPGFCTKAGG